MKITTTHTTTVRRRRRYGVKHFLFDLFMLAITGGLWVIWILIRMVKS